MDSRDLNLELKIIQNQKEMCNKYGAKYIEAPLDKIIGVAIETFSGVNSLWPINGLRHPDQTDNVVNWYVWAGEVFSESPDFFKPMHIRHLLTMCPKTLNYLGLGPGWRFLFDDRYEDVWFDESLLII